MAKTSTLQIAQRPQKSVTLDFTRMRGHAADANISGYLEFPEGFYHAANIWQIRTDDVLTTRTTYTKDTDDTTTYAPISCWNGGGSYSAPTAPMMVVASSNGSATAFQRYDVEGASDTSFTWSSSGSAPALSNTDFNPTWARVGNNIVFCFRNTAPITLDLTADQSHWTTGTALSASYGICCTHLNRVCVVFQGKPDRIYYSDAGNSEAGYSGYATVGGLEEPIYGLFELNGQLVVLKSKSIWQKGAYATIEDTNFLPVATGIPEPIPNAFVVANNVLYYVNRGGMFAWGGGGTPVNISMPIWSYFQQNNIGNIQQARIGYWQALNKIWIKFGGSDVVHFYDINRQKWEQMINLAWFTSTNVGSRYFALSNASTEYRQWNDFTVIGAGKNETSLHSYLNTGWLDFGAMNYKIIKSIVFDGSGIDQVIPYGANNLSTSATALPILTPTSNKVIFAPNNYFRKWMFIFYTTTSAPIVLRSCIITYEEVQEL